jgi:formylglycine-generating enzyme
MNRLFLIALLIGMPVCARAVTIDLVSVGNPNNNGELVPGVGLFGRVTKSFQMGRTEVTNAQYVEFLNAKAAADPFALYNPSMGIFSDGGITRSGEPGTFTYSVRATATGAGPGGTDYTYGDKAVNYVSWYDAIRFANWMNNGQGSGNTETGAYTLLGSTPVPSNAEMITRNSGATWFLPNENEWYKAAYYNASTLSYFDYPTSTDTAPTNELPSADTGNSANFVADSTTTGDPGYPLTSAGAYQLSDSPYGTLDQGGNVAEWSETLFSAGKRVRRGGAWNTAVTSLNSATRDSMSAALDNSSTGFRLASVVPASPVAGDYNGNGSVDAADYVVWRNNSGAAFQLPNEVPGVTPGMVTQEDYDAWRTRFGNTAGSAAGNAANSPVPEATTLVLAIVSCCMIGIGRSIQFRRD